MLQQIKAIREWNVLTNEETAATTELHRSGSAYSSGSSVHELPDVGAPVLPDAGSSVLAGVGDLEARLANLQQS